MPYRVFAKLGRAFKTAAGPLRYAVPMQHSPVCFQRILRNARSSSLARYYPRLPFMGCSLREHLLFQSKIGIEIDLVRLDGFMAEPKCNQGPIDSPLEAAPLRLCAEHMG